MPSKKSLGTRLGDTLPQGKALDVHEDPMDDYEAHGHLKTLIDAHQIKNNPDKMARVKKLAGRHADAIKGLIEPKSIKGVKQAYNDKYGSGGSENNND